MTRFHNPGCVGEATELFNEDVVVAGKDVGLWNNIHIDVAALVVFLCHRVVFTLEIFAVPFDILYHQVFLTQFITVWEVVQDLEIIQTEARVGIENSTINCPRQGPIHVPLLLTACSGPPSALEVCD